MQNNPERGDRQDNIQCQFQIVYAVRLTANPPLVQGTTSCLLGYTARHFTLGVPCCLPQITPSLLNICPDQPVGVMQWLAVLPPVSTANSVCCSGWARRNAGRNWTWLKAGDYLSTIPSQHKGPGCKSLWGFMFSPQSSQFKWCPCSDVFLLNRIVQVWSLGFFCMKLGFGSKLKCKNMLFMHLTRLDLFCILQAFLQSHRRFIDSDGKNIYFIIFICIY